MQCRYWRRSDLPSKPQFCGRLHPLLCSPGLEIRNLRWPFRRPHHLGRPECIRPQQQLILQRVLSFVLYIPNLVYLDLRLNSFLGPIPDALFDKRLDAIFLNNNQLDSEILDNFSKPLASVNNLGYNKFTG
ncbi:unnamed protein product [Linum tenue]|uniref:Uncharacterized protein n=1 Tax=Linum tenue TaxID=586396 RepID=A0AAV0MNV1_9ROSI|nr:unnamed protein product [Linum tenue]